MTIVQDSMETAEPVADPESWWMKELEKFWGDSSYVVTMDTRRAVKVACNLLTGKDHV